MPEKVFFGDSVLEQHQAKSSAPISSIHHEYDIAGREFSSPQYTWQSQRQTILTCS